MKFIASFLLLFLTLNTHSYEFPTPDFSSPRMTMNYFLKTMKGYKLGHEEGLELALRSLDLSELDEASRIESGKIAAKKIVNTIDRIEYINVNKVPHKFKKDKWVFKRELIVLDGQAFEVEISIAKNKKGLWLFSPKTISTIHLYERHVHNRDIVAGAIKLETFNDKIKSYMPEWTGKRSFILLNGQWLGIFVVIFISLLFDKILKLYIGNLAIRLLKKRNIQIDEKQKEKFLKPVGVMAFAGFWTLGIRFLELQDSALSWMLRFGYIIFTVGGVVAAYHFVDYVCLFLEEKAQESENKFDDILVPLIRKTSKFFVIAVGIVFIGDSLTLDMKSIIAGLGIGGFAFALAAKDTISNLFGSITVILDRPFRIGDYVNIDGSIEGMIEEVGMRSTRVRTFYDSLITVPNGKLTNVHIDNYGQRRYRRLSTHINVQYDTPPEKIEAFCEGIRELIANHKWTRKDNFHVYFNNMGAHSLDILVYVFWQVTDWSQELAEKHRLLIDILRLGNELGIDFAFPTQTLHIFNEESKTTDSFKIDDFHKFGKEKADSITQRPISFQNTRSSLVDGKLPEDKISL